MSPALRHLLVRRKRSLDLARRWQWSSSGHEFARRRQDIIVANAELRERELIKLASWASAITGALCGRGAPEPAADLAAEAGMAVFRNAFERWVGETTAETCGTSSATHSRS